MRLPAALLRHPTLRPALALALLAPLLALSSLARQQGYELATALGLMLTLVGNLPAMALVQRRRKAGVGGEPLALFLAAWGINLLLCAPAFVASLLAATVPTPCDPLAGLPFCALLIPSCAALAAASGLLFTLLIGDGRKAELAHLVAALVSAIVTAWPLVAGPQVFAFNLFAGYFPGPIYDEALRVTSPLLWARLEAGLWTIAALGLASRSVDRTSLAWSWRRRSLRSTGVLGLALAGLALVRLHAGDIGLRTTDADVEHVLAGVRETPHFRIHFAAERPQSDVERLARDLEFRYTQDAAFVGVEEEQKVAAFCFRAAEEKQRWVGAAETDFAKPWLHQFHLQLEGIPDRVAKHELAHVLANALGVRPFGVAGGSLIPNAGLIEGLATAADDPVDDLTLDQWAAAMRKLGLAPDLNALLSASGFWSQEQGRAYTIVGSFLRWIARTRGTKALQGLYHSGDFAACCGASLAALAAQWGAEIDRVPLNERALHIAQRRFSAPSLFTQVCARETAHLREEAQAVGASEPERARAIFERLEQLEPGNPDPLFGEADLLEGAHRGEEARQALDRLLALPHLGEAPRANAELSLAAFAIRAGESAEAEKRLREVLTLQPDASSTRQAELRLSVLGTPSGSAVLDRYFRRVGREESLLALSDLALAQPALLAPRYLLGRRLTDLAQPALALRYLATEPNPEDLHALPEVAREWHRLRIRDEALRLECEALQKDAAALLTLDEGPATARGLPDARWSADWSERCLFERATFRTPVELD